MSDGPFDFGWSESAQRFIDLITGRFVSAEHVREVMTARINESFTVLKDFGEALVSGAADVSEWELAVRVELKNIHTQMAALASGGWDNVTPQQWGTVGARLKVQYQKLNELSLALSRGEISEAEFRRRMDMYARGAWGSYYDAERIMKEDAGYTEEIRNLGGGDNCRTCLGEAGRWAPIGTLRRIGDSECLSNCNCTFDYR